MNRDQTIQELNRIDAAVEAKAFKIFFPVLKKQGRDVAAFIRKYGIQDAMHVLPMLIRQEDLTNAYVAFYSYGGLVYAKWQYNKLDQGYKKIGGKISKWLQKWLQSMKMYVYTDLGNMIREVNDTTLDNIRKVLEESNQDGLGADKTASKVIEQTEGEIGKKRALRIVRTENTRLASKGQKLAADSWKQETGSKMYKEWASIHDHKTRPDHREADGQTIEADLKFNIGGIGMDAPGDPTAPPGQSINCRCRALYISERVLNRRL